MRRIQLLVFSRARRQDHLGTGTPHAPDDREHLAKQLGAASRVTVHGRVYERSSAAAVLDFMVQQSCFGDERPTDGLRPFALTKTDINPTLPWNNTNMATLPDDGTFSFEPDMVNAALQAQVSGGAGEWVDFEMWATLSYDE